MLGLNPNLFWSIFFLKVTFEMTPHCTGHAQEGSTQDPPRGLQFLLATPSNGSVSDTITMANLGYLQLKANPGVWDMIIRPGKGRDIYEFTSVTDDYGRQGTLIDNIGARVVLNGFEGVTLYPTVSKKVGMETEDVLGNKEGESEGGIWDSLKSA